MKNLFNDEYYCLIIKDILENENFNKLNSIEHHGTTRMMHSMRVSYYSYLVSKKLKLRAKEVARAGLLHDFFMSYEDRTKFERFLSTFTHPKYAAINVKNEFLINDLEYDIIRTHMFPINIAIPKYTESWIVSIVDKIVATYEFATSYKYIFKHAFNYLYIFYVLQLFNKL